MQTAYKQSTYDTEIFCGCTLHYFTVVSLWIRLGILREGSHIMRINVRMPADDSGGRSCALVYAASKSDWSRAVHLGRTGEWRKAFAGQSSNSTAAGSAAAAPINLWRKLSCDAVDSDEAVRSVAYRCRTTVSIYYLINCLICRLVPVYRDTYQWFRHRCQRAAAADRDHAQHHVACHQSWSVAICSNTALSTVRR